MFKCTGIVFYVTMTIIVSNSDTVEQSEPLESPYFSSLFKMESLLNIEETVINNIQSYLEKESIRLNHIERWLNYFKNEYKNALNNVEYVKNPINAFKLIKSLTRYLWGIESIIRDNVAYNRDESLKLPSMTDLRGTVEAISRIQQTYKLDAKDLAQGILKGTYSENKQLYYDKTSGLNLDDCYILARTLYEDTFYTTAMEWVELALQKYDSENDTRFYNFSRADIVSLLIYTKLALGNVTDAELLYNTSPDLAQNKRIQETISKYSNVKDDLPLMKRYSYQKTHLIDYVIKDMEIVNALCRGEKTLNDTVIKKKSAIRSPLTTRLSCKFHRTNPFLKLAPIKMEQLYNDPEMFIFYDVLNDREIEWFKTVAAPELEPVGLYVKQPVRGIENVRCGQGYFLGNKANATASTTAILRRFSDMTGLNMAMAEQQVINYGIGGYYEPHVDAFEGKLPEYFAKKGNRLATILVYLSDVKQGGATAFPAIDLTVFPVKGAALFWYNLDHKGEIPGESEHTACPVLAGEKWSLNVWAHENDQTSCRLKKY